MEEFGISRCKLLYIGWVNSKVILYSTENYIQYSVINHNEKEYKKNTHMHTEFPTYKCIPFPECAPKSNLFVSPTKLPQVPN